MTAATRDGSGPAPLGASRPSFAEAFAVWLQIGFLSFGGPAGQIALMHKVLVDERRWIEEARFLHALNFCMLLPGPEAQQLATYIGWLLHGVKGGLTAGLLFILPGFFVILALSILYVGLGDAPVAQGLLFGLKAAVLAVVVEALLRVARRALKTRAMVGVAIVAFLAIAFFGAPFPLIVLAAGLFGLLAARFAPRLVAAGRKAAPDASALAGDEAPPRSGAFGMALVCAAAWLVPVAGLWFVLGRGHVFTQEALFFSKVAVVTFGGAYAVLAYVAQQAVEVYGWLGPDEMLAGLGLAETTPGPLILVLTFVGFLGAFRGETGLDPYVAGALGALLTTWVTFAPCFLWIFLGAPFIERLRASAALSGSLSAITAAVVGVIANLGLWFGLHVLFGTVREERLGPLFVSVPDLSTFIPSAALIALAAGILLLRFHVNMIVTLALAASAGILLRLFAFS